MAREELIPVTNLCEQRRPSCLLVKEDESDLIFLGFLYPEKDFFPSPFLKQMKFSRH